MRFIVKILVALAVLNLTAGCSPPNDPLPNKLKGVWITSDPRYADRSFQITPEWIVFKTGQKSYSSHPIIRISKTEAAEGSLYTLIYSNENGREYRLSFIYYDNRDGGVLRFKNQDILWTRSEG